MKLSSYKDMSISSNIIPIRVYKCDSQKVKSKIGQGFAHITMFNYLKWCKMQSKWCRIGLYNNVQTQTWKHYHSGRHSQRQSCDTFSSLPVGNHWHENRCSCPRIIPEQSQLQTISSVQVLGFHFEPVDPNNFGKELMREFLQISYRIHFKTWMLYKIDVICLPLIKSEVLELFHRFFFSFSL